MERPPAVIRTQRLSLREFSMADLDALAGLYRDPFVMRYLGGVRDAAAALASIVRMMASYPAQGFGLWAVVRESDGALVGRCGLVPWTIYGRHEIEVSYLIGGEYWFQGFATEAAAAVVRYAEHRLAYPRVIALVHPENRIAQIVAERSGLAYRGDLNHDAVPFKPVRIYATKPLERPESL